VNEKSTASRGVRTGIPQYPARSATARHEEVESRVGRGRSKEGPGRDETAPEQARCQQCREA